MNADQALKLAQTLRPMLRNEGVRVQVLPCDTQGNYKLVLISMGEPVLNIREPREPSEVLAAIGA